MRGLLSNKELSETDEVTRRDMRKILVRSYAVIHDPKHHTVAVEARDKDGCEVDVYEDEAVQFCLLGATTVATILLDDKLEHGDSDHTIGLLNQCAIDLYPDDCDTSMGLPVAAQINDRLGHEAALKLLRCGVKKLRAAEKEAN